MDQISDQSGQCFICHTVDAFVFIDSHPADRFATWGHSPDHHVALSVVHLLPDRCDLVSVADVDGPVAPVGIELVPCGGLDGEGGHDVVVVHVAIVMPPGGQTRGRVDGLEVVTVVVVHDVIFGRHRSIILPPEFFSGCEHLYRIEVGKLIEFVHFRPKNLRADRPNWARTIKTRSSNIRRKRNQRRNLSPHCCHE